MRHRRDATTLHSDNIGAVILTCDNQGEYHVYRFLGWEENPITGCDGDGHWGWQQLDWPGGRLNS